MNKFLIFLLLALATFMGLVSADFGNPSLGKRDMVHEYITHADGTVGHFSYSRHHEFISVNSTSRMTSSYTDLADDFSTAVEGRNQTAVMDILLDLVEVLYDKNDTTSNQNDATNITNGPVNRLQVHFTGSQAFENISMCGLGVPIPDWNPATWLRRPNTYDCVRLLETMLHRFGYWDLSHFMKSSYDMDWQVFLRYDSCELPVRRIDQIQDWGARVGNLDLIGWGALAFLAAFGMHWEDPTFWYYLPSITGTIACQELGPNPRAALEFGLVRWKDADEPTGSMATGRPTPTSSDVVDFSTLPFPSVSGPYTGYPDPNTMTDASLTSYTDTFTGDSWMNSYTTGLPSSVWDFAPPGGTDFPCPYGSNCNGTATLPTVPRTTVTVPVTAEPTTVTVTVTTQSSASVPAPGTTTVTEPTTTTFTEPTTTTFTSVTTYTPDPPCPAAPTCSCNEDMCDRCSPDCCANGTCSTRLE